MSAKEVKFGVDARDRMQCSKEKEGPAEMPGLSVVDDDNGMELTGLRQASLTFKHTDFQGWRDNPD